MDVVEKTKAEAHQYVCEKGGRHLDLGKKSSGRPKKREGAK